MIVTTKLKVDLQNKGIAPRIDVVQGDTNTRAVELMLYAQGRPFQVPEGVTAQMRYRKADGTAGVYDTLPDGTQAWKIEGNALTLIMAPQMLTAAGSVMAQAELIFGANSLATFELQVEVARNVAAGVIKSENYVNMRSWLLSALNTALQEAKDSGDFTPRISMGTITTLRPGSAAAASISGDPQAPALNLGIPEGYTPQKGVDYWTTEEQLLLQAAVEEKLLPEITSKVQQHLIFAECVEECTDTSALYMLPDGYIYATVDVQEEGFSGNNLVPVSQAEDSAEVFNDGLGYQDGMYLSSSSGTHAEKEGHTVTGMIPYSVLYGVVPETIYIRGGTPSRIGYYLEDKSFKLTYSSSTTTAFTFTQLDTDYWMVTPNMEESGNSNLYDNQGEGGYLRFDVICDSGAGLMLTLGEPIVETTISVPQWVCTQIPVVATDYTDRIVTLEDTARDQEQRLKTLEEKASPEIPDYVLQEAERVADLALEKRNGRCLCFAALSDIHYPYDDASDDTTTAQSLTHAALGIAQIRKVLPLDFLSVLGDHVKGGIDSTLAESKAALKWIRRTLYEAGLGLRQIWLQGNHDRNPYTSDDGDLTDDALYSYIFAGNTAVVDSENVQRGYGYQDFEAQQIRVIYLNSSDLSGAKNVYDHMWSAAQLRWLAEEALDFSAKTGPEDWGVVVLSHQPLNWGTVPAFTILEGYVSGAKGSVMATEGETVAFDFTDATAAEVICCINGHTHNFRCSRIGASGIWQIAVPQICAGRYNEYGVSWPEIGGELDGEGNPVYYYKVANTAEDTSFCLFLIDRKNRKIHALHYGAGIDRELEY